MALPAHRRSPSGRTPGLPAVAALLLLGVASTGCRTPEPSSEAMPAGSGQSTTIETREFRFSPRTVEIERETPIIVTVHNAGVVAHTFTSDDPGFDVIVPAGQRRTVTFQPAGRVSFFCRYHQSDGMKGVFCPRGEECTPQLFP